MSTRGHHGLMLNAGAPPPPTGMYLGATDTPGASSVNSINVNLPASVNVGDLLIIQHVNNANNTSTTPSGWTSLITTNASTTLRQTLFYKVADGSEGGTTVAITASNTGGRSAVCHRIAAGTYGAFGATGANDSTGTSTAPNPPSRTSGLGAVDTLWLAACSYRGTPTITSFPLTDNQHAHPSILVSNQIGIGSCTVENSLATFDPGAFTISAGGQWVAHTISIEAL